MASSTTNAANAGAGAATQSAINGAPIQSLDQSIGNKVWVLLKNDKELEGTLIGVDELVNMVMEDVVELVLDPTTGTSKEVGRIDEILLNGNNVAMIVKGGRPK